MLLFGYLIGIELIKSEEAELIGLGIVGVLRL